MAKPPPAKLRNVAVKLDFGFLSVDGTWEADEAQQRAAWEMYVELVTRVAIVDLHPEEGTLREALSSLHSLFDTTREILRRHGPGVAQSKEDHRVTFGYLAVAILNRGVRPVLAKWHPMLTEYEDTRDPLVAKSKIEHERRWDKSSELRKVLTDLRPVLKSYGDLLAQAAGVESLIEEA